MQYTRLGERGPNVSTIGFGAWAIGAGWGQVGLCPGPAIAVLGIDGLGALVFVLAMLAGMAAYHLGFERRRRSEAAMGSAGKT